ncbi:hypothetical protein P7F88_18025 [Vibrio hannami]|uniref:hypothetical protein n=1 Tax=Vibrio hannami TaxID=2717094 RepID=UPI00240EAF0C|nr:hypothetical protein [Vibrio hannami]MDG3087865.1 hypothetical protein [Vibrio hannami]
MDLFQLDIRTLSFLTVLYSFVFGAGLVFVAFMQSSFNGIRHFAFGLISLGIGFLLLTLRGIVPDYMSIVIANILIVLGYVLLSFGLERFRGLSGKLSMFGSAMLVAMSIAFIYYTYFEPSISQRLIWINTIMAIQSAICASCLFRGKQKELLIAKWMTALPFVFSTAFFIFRALWSLEQGNFKSFMSAGAFIKLPS